MDCLSVLLPSGSKDWKWGKAVSRMIRNVIFDIDSILKVYYRIIKQEYLILSCTNDNYTCNYREHTIIYKI